MGRQKTMTKEDKLAYGREYYYKTKGDRAHEYSLVSRRSYLRKQLRTATDDAKIAQLNQQIEAINAELDSIRSQRWIAKREAGGALFKKWDAAGTRSLRDTSKDKPSSE